VARAAKVEVKGEDKKVSVGAPVSVPKAAAEPVTVVKAPISGPVGKARLSARPGPKAGEVTLFWQHVDSAEDYHLVYGRAPGKYEYGALNIGRVNRFTVRQLSPGATYYFAIIPIFGQPLYTTEAVKAVAKMNITVIQTTPEALGKPTVELNKPSPPVVSEQPTITPPGEKTGGPTVPSSTPSAQPQVNPLED